MRLQAVLNQIEGLEKRFVYYLESQGTSTPRSCRRRASPAGTTLWRTWSGSAESGTTTSAGSRCNGPMSWSREPRTGPTSSRAPRWAEALDLLHLSDHVIEARPLRRDGGRGGPPAGAPRADVHNVLDRLFEAGFVAGACRCRASRPSQSGSAPGTAPRATAQRERGGAGDAGAGADQGARMIGALIEELRNYRGIVEGGIYGEDGRDRQAGGAGPRPGRAGGAPSRASTPWNPPAPSSPSGACTDRRTE